MKEMQRISLYDNRRTFPRTPDPTDPQLSLIVDEIRRLNKNQKDKKNKGRDGPVLVVNHFVRGTALWAV